MSSRSRPGARATSEETKNQIKAAAQMLFARRGVDGVTVQEIVTAAGQRNNAALHYHFGYQRGIDPPDGGRRGRRARPAPPRDA